MKYFLYILSFCIYIVFTFCDSKDIENYSSIDTFTQKDTSVFHPKISYTPLDMYYTSLGLINIKQLDSSIHVALLYGTTSNFLHKNIYNGLSNCYLPCEVAIKLCNAQRFLKEFYPYYSIVVFDAVRPLHVQKMMWDSLKIPFATKINYLAHPKELSLHNYGAAVDVGIISEACVLLDMGTSFDFFGELAEPRKEQALLQSNKLSKEVLFNRMLLRRVMKRAGFYSITTEWWHFNVTNKEFAAKKFKLIE